jgi:hypothetical protein
VNWDEQARADAIAAADAREPGYYWVRRNEPDGPSAWEIGHFVKNPLPGWYFTGTSSRYLEIAKPFSNAWEIGQRIQPEEP